MREGRVIGLVAEVLVVVFQGGYHRVVNHNARNYHVPGIDGAGRDHPLNLGDNYAPAVPGGVGQSQLVYYGSLLFHGDVAVLVDGSAADDGHVDGEGFVPQVLLASELYDLNKLLRGQRVALAALETRVDEGSQAGLCDYAGTACAYFPVELAQSALWKQVGLNLAGINLRLQRRSEVIMAGNDTLEHADVREMAHAPVLAVSDAGRVRDRQAARMPAGGEAVFHDLEHVLRASRAHKARYAYGSAVLNHGHSFLCVY